MLSRSLPLYCLSAAAAALVLSAPPAASFTLQAGETERDAELLVVGKYPAKNLTVTEQDLDDIVAQFSADTVPIRVEHVNSPLDPFGTVSQLWRDGRRLLAKISFDAAAVPLIAKRAVKGLSCGLSRVAGKLCLSEVSLVLKPHVPSAALLSDDPDDRIAALEAKLTALDADTRIADLKRKGKLVPATELLARQLLSFGDAAAITLADGSTRSVADAAFALLSALPATVKFTETAASKKVNLYGGPGGAAASAGDADTDEEEDLPALTGEQMDYITRVLKVDPPQSAARDGENESGWMMHLFSPTVLIAIGVGVQLVFTLAHHLFTKPAQQAQLDSIEHTVNDLLNTVSEPAEKEAA